MYSKRLNKRDSKIWEFKGQRMNFSLDTNYMMPTDMEEFKLVADGNSVINPNVKREGLVLRDPKTDLSLKNVSREYLLKH